MEEDLSLEPVQSVAPVLSLQPLHNTIARKYWHIICRSLFRYLEQKQLYP